MYKIIIFPPKINLPPPPTGDLLASWLMHTEQIKKVDIDATDTPNQENQDALITTTAQYFTAHFDRLEIVLYVLHWYNIQITLTSINKIPPQEKSTTALLVIKQIEQSICEIEATLKESAAATTSSQEHHTYAESDNLLLEYWLIAAKITLGQKKVVLNLLNNTAEYLKLIELYDTFINADPKFTPYLPYEKYYLLLEKAELLLLCIVTDNKAELIEKLIQTLLEAQKNNLQTTKSDLAIKQKWQDTIKSFRKFAASTNKLAASLATQFYIILQQNNLTPWTADELKKLEQEIITHNPRAYKLIKKKTTAKPIDAAQPKKDQPPPPLGDLSWAKADQPITKHTTTTMPHKKHKRNNPPSAPTKSQLPCKQSFMPPPETYSPSSAAAVPCLESPGEMQKVRKQKRKKKHEPESPSQETAVALTQTPPTLSEQPTKKTTTVSTTSIQPINKSSIPIGSSPHNIWQTQDSIRHLFPATLQQLAAASAPQLPAATPKHTINIDLLDILPDKITPLLIHELHKLCTSVYLDGSYMRHYLLLSNIPSAHKISDIDFLVYVKDSEAKIKLIEALKLQFNFIHTKMDNVLVYFPYKTNPTDQLPFIPINVNIICLTETVAKPCLYFDTLRVPIPESLHCDFIALPREQNPWEIVMYPDGVEQSIGTPCLEDIFTFNPTEIIRCLRIINDIDIWHASQQILLKQIHDHALTGALLNNLNFDQLLSALTKIFWRGDATAFFNKYPLVYCAFAACLRPAFANFYIIMAEPSSPDPIHVATRDFITQMLSIFDQSTTLPHKNRVAILFGLLFFIEYISSTTTLPYVDFALSSMIKLFSKLHKDMQIPVWLQLSTANLTLRKIANAMQSFHISFYEMLRSKLTDTIESIAMIPPPQIPNPDEYIRTYLELWHLSPPEPENAPSMVIH